MKMLNGLSLVVLLVVAILLGLRSCTLKVRPGEVGVLTEEWGQGLVEEDYGPGFHLDLGPLHSWAVFDTTVQSLSMVAKSPEGALQVKSADGATVTMDITIKFHIKQGECWSLRKELGTGDSYKTKVRNESLDALRDVFGGMTTEDFYIPEKREEKAALTKTALSKRLDVLHVHLVDILVRDVSFEESYEQRIKEGAVATQQAEVNAALRNAAFYRGETQKVEAESTAKVTVINQGLEKTRRELTSDNEVKIAKIQADSERYVIEQRADADLFAAEKEATALLLVKNAEAQAKELLQTSLQGSGAKNLIALEAARNLQLTTFTLSTLDTDLLDIGKLAEKLGSLSVK
ncbi:MAG: hypothetical protein KDC95_02585 [Planctomycetes bacterium]|nr:hypothetical protein [Planctomycetota bacterium]